MCVIKIVDVTSTFQSVWLSAVPTTFVLDSVTAFQSLNFGRLRSKVSLTCVAISPRKDSAKLIAYNEVTLQV